MRTLRRFSLLAGVTLLSACSTESATLPSAPSAALQRAPSPHSLGALSGALTLVTGARRTTPLLTPLSAAKFIGSEGGTLSIPQAGVTVIIPAGALAVPTLISMVARKGALIAYDFAPHGLTFAKPLVLTQDLAGTNVSLLMAPLLQLGYYADPTLLSDLGGSVSEFETGASDLLGRTFTSTIPHFSGYMVACGRE